MLKILTIVGARPQFIKAAAICRAVAKEGRGVMEETLLHTGQHYDDNMSARFFSELALPQPRYNLGLGGATAERMAAAISHVIRAEHYDAMLVYGDTTSTLAGALAAEEVGLPLCHVEAGLRSHNSAMPEEHNRIETDRRSCLLFAPTQRAVNNLCREGIAERKIVQTGDVMLDNVLRYGQKTQPMPSAGNDNRPYILATVHRNFNADNPERMAAIMQGLCHAAKRLDAEVIMPVHPRVAKQSDMNQLSGGDGRIHLVQPMGYMQTLAALRGAALVATDSGGLQKEAFFCQKPSILLREETEWQEIVDCGAAALTGVDVAVIESEAARMWNVRVEKPSQFGDGTAAEQIVRCMVERL